MRLIKSFRLAHDFTSKIKPCVSLHGSTSMNDLNEWPQWMTSMNDRNEWPQWMTAMNDQWPQSHPPTPTPHQPDHIPIEWGQSQVPFLLCNTKYCWDWNRWGGSISTSWLLRCWQGQTSRSGERFFLVALHWLHWFLIPKSIKLALPHMFPFKQQVATLLCLCVVVTKRWQLFRKRAKVNGDNEHWMQWVMQ